MRIWALVLCSLFFLAPQGQGEDVDEMESILDRLEQRLLQNERASSTFLLDDDEMPLNERGNPDVSGREVVISGDLPENDALKALARTLNDIESEVDRLVGDIQRTNQKIVEHSKVNNFVEIDTEIKNPENLIIRQMNVFLDEFEVYRLDLSKSVHLQRKSIPIFAGPLEPGRHKMKVSVKFTEIENGALPLKQGGFAAVDQSFDLEVPPGFFKKKWAINLVKESNGDSYHLKLK